MKDTTPSGANDLRVRRHRTVTAEALMQSVSATPRRSGAGIYVALISLDAAGLPRNVCKYAWGRSPTEAELAAWLWCWNVGLRPTRIKVVRALDQEPANYDAPGHFIRL